MGDTSISAPHYWSAQVEPGSLAVLRRTGPLLQENGLPLLEPGPLLEALLAQGLNCQPASPPELHEAS